jgi:hypothetical protein
MVFQGARTPIRRPGKSAIRWPILVPESRFRPQWQSAGDRSRGRLRRGVCGLRLTRSLAKKRRYFGDKPRHRQPNRSDIGGAEFRARPTRAASIHLQRHHLSAGRNHQTPGVVGRHLNRIVSNRAARDFQRVLIFPGGSSTVGPLACGPPAPAAILIVCLLMVSAASLSLRPILVARQ